MSPRKKNQKREQNKNDRANLIVHFRHCANPFLSALPSRVARSFARRSVNSSTFGTGSNPPFVNGRHRNNRFTASTLPRQAPCFAIASYPYLEHEG